MTFDGNIDMLEMAFWQIILSSAPVLLIALAIELHIFISAFEPHKIILFECFSMILLARCENFSIDHILLLFEAPGKRTIYDSLNKNFSFKDVNFGISKSNFKLLS